MVVAITHISNGHPCEVPVSSVYDLTIRLNGLAGVHGRHSSVAGRAATRRVVSSQVLSAAVEVACTYYCHRVKCLQRSVVCREMLRRHGFRAEVVVGVQQFPFYAHAWVELDGAVVNDFPRVKELYQVLDRW